MRYFEEELTFFLSAHGLPSLEVARPDGWAHFFHLYAQIVEDCPLVLQYSGVATTIASVTLKMELARQPQAGELFYKVRWIVEDTTGACGEIFVYNSFTLTPEGDEDAASLREL